MLGNIIVKDSTQLRRLVLQAIDGQGPACDLNHLDVSAVENFDALFMDTNFCGDVSRWNMKSANSTMRMFKGTPFNGTILSWTIEHLIGCQAMDGMFADTTYSQDLAPLDIACINEKLIRYGDIIRSKYDKHANDFEYFPTVALPDALRKNTVKMYAALFGGSEGLAAYFNRVPFGLMHFDACSVADYCPAGIANEDFLRSRELIRVGSAMELDNTQVRAMCKNLLQSRNAGIELPLDFLGSMQP